MNALSESLTAKVFREGKEYEQTYRKGKAESPVKEVGKSDKRGTLVTFTPDKEIFKEVTEFDYDILANRMRELSFLNKGITISITDNRKKDKKGDPVKEIFHSKEGLSEFIKYIDESREPIINEIIKMEGEKNNIPVEVAMIYNSSFSENLHSYVNNINTHEGGTHLSGFRLSLIHI